MFHSGIANVKPEEHFVWINKINGRKVSKFGSLPWLGGGNSEDWEMISEGYTLKVTHKDGSTTYGLGRKPFTTFDDAKAFADNCNERHA